MNSDRVYLAMLLQGIKAYLPRKAVEDLGCLAGGNTVVVEDRAVLRQWIRQEMSMQKSGF